MIDEEISNALITHRIEQAKETISEVELLIAHTKYRAAVSRIYYGIFYAVSALATKHQFLTSKHGQLIGWFNKTFIKKGIFHRNYGKILRESFEVRNQGDYDAFIEFSGDDVLKRFEEMKDFINTVEHYLLTEKN